MSNYQSPPAAQVTNEPPVDFQVTDSQNLVHNVPAQPVSNREKDPDTLVEEVRGFGRYLAPLGKPEPVLVDTGYDTCLSSLCDPANTPQSDLPVGDVCTSLAVHRSSMRREQ